MTADSNYKHQTPFPFLTAFCTLYQRYYSSLNCTVRASVEQNCVTVLKEIGLSSQLCFIPLPTALLNSVIACSEHKTTKVMICTYW
jgi:hypothetical protein